MNGQRSTDTISLSLPPGHLKLARNKADALGVSVSFLIRSLIEEFLTGYDLVRSADSLGWTWEKRESGNA